MVRKCSPFKFVNMRENKKMRENKRYTVKNLKNQVHFNL